VQGRPGASAFLRPTGIPPEQLQRIGQSATSPFRFPQLPVATDEEPVTSSLSAGYSPPPRPSAEEVQNAINASFKPYPDLQGANPAVSRADVDAATAALGGEEKGYPEEVARLSAKPQTPTARVSLPKGTEAQASVDEMPEMLNGLRDDIAHIPSSRPAGDTRWLETVNAARNLAAIENRYRSVIEDVDLTSEDRSDYASLILQTKLELGMRAFGSVERDFPSDRTGKAAVAMHLARMLTQVGPTSDDAQAKFLGDLYDKLVQQRGQGEQGDYYARAFSKEEFVNSFVFVPDSVFPNLSDAAVNRRGVLGYQLNGLAVVPDGLANMRGVANEEGLGRFGDRPRWAPATATYEHIVNHEASHLLVDKLNPEFRRWAAQFAEKTGLLPPEERLHPEEMFASLNAQDQSPSRPIARRGMTFPNLAEQTAALKEWNSAMGPSNRTSTVLSAYDPITDTGDFFSNVAGAMELSNSTLAPEDVHTQYSPEEIRAAAQDLINRARLGRDPQAMATVNDLMEKWALPFFRGLTGYIPGPTTP
jgi:hypothetical protein